jgi:hypothetical protein
MRVSIADLWRMNMHALDVAFLHDEPLRARLKADFAGFAASDADLRELVQGARQVGGVQGDAGRPD